MTHRDKVQQRAANAIKGLQHLMCEERLGDQGPFSLGRRRLQGILLMCTNTSGEGAKRTEPNSSVVSSGRARSNGHNLKHRKILLKIRKLFLTVRVTEHWHRFLRGVVESPSLEKFKTLWATGSAWLCMSRRGCTKWPSEVNSHLRYSMVV